jgi:hypothetical protein
MRLGQVIQSAAQGDLKTTDIAKVVRELMPEPAADYEPEEKWW